MLPQPSPSSRRWRQAVLGVAAALVLALLGWLGWQSLSRRAAPPVSVTPMTPVAPIASVVPVTPIAAPGNASPPAAAGAGWALVQSQLCLRCHGMEQTHVGPGFAQIAQRYRGQPDAPDYLARKIRQGSAGVWGRKLMPRQPGITPEQAQAMAVWLLAQPDPVPR